MTKLTSGQITLIVIGVVLLLIILWVAGSYNGLVRQDETVNEKWANVQTAYQRRADLIPNLIATVQEAVEFEKGTQTQIAALRTGAIAAKDALSNAKTIEETQAAIQQSEQVMTQYRGLNINVENYPQLRATENFLSLQDELAGTENRIKTERDIYNAAVKAMNIKVRRFPTNIIAGIFGFEKKESFEADAGADEVPEVKELFN